MCYNIKVNDSTYQVKWVCALIFFEGRSLILGIFAKWRDRCAPIRFLVKAQKTVWYPVLFAILCIIGGTHDHTVYIPIMWTLAIFVLFSVLFTDDNKVFLVPLLMIFFSIGCDTRSDAFVDSNGDMLAFMDASALTNIILLGTLAVGSFIIRLACDGSIAEAFKRRRLFTVSIIAMDIAFLTNGMFSDKYNIANLGYGALMAMGFTVVYFIVSGMLTHSEDPISYACVTMVATAYVALLQIMQVAVELHKKGKFFLFFDAERFGVDSILINKDDLALGWGISTVIAAVFVLGIPAAMYLAREKKLSLFFYFSSVLFVLGTVIINVRSAMFIGALALIVSMIICCIKGKNRVLIRVYTAVFALLCIIALIAINYTLVSLSSLVDKVVEILRLGVGVDEARGELWANGIEDFKSSPWFGVGFNDGGYADEFRKNNVFSNMYHCIFVEIPGAMGVVGCIAFLIHIVSLGILFFKRMSVNKLLLLLVPIMIIGMSIVDNFFFYLHFQIFYGAFVALAELTHTKEQTK